MSFTTTAHGEVAQITIATGPANAMGRTFFSGLLAAFEGAKDARAIVLTGSGSAFSAGLDLPGLLTLDEPTVHTLIQDFSHLMETIFVWPAPTVAALNGHTIAGGFVLASACDWRLLARGGAKLGMTGVSLGIAYPSLVTSMLQYTVPKAAWHTVMLEGRLFDVDGAERNQLVDALCDATELPARALEKATALATADREAYARTKRMLKWEAVERARELAAETHAAFSRGLFEPKTRARLEAAVAKLKARSK